MEFRVYDLSPLDIGLKEFMNMLPLLWMETTIKMPSDMTVKNIEYIRNKTIRRNLQCFNFSLYTYNKNFMVKIIFKKKNHVDQNQSINFIC